jgi:hypothetical protein
MATEEEDADQGMIEQSDQHNEIISSIQPEATRNLIVFSFLMFTIPLAVMYVTYRFLFLGKNVISNVRSCASAIYIS